MNFVSIGIEQPHLKKQLGLNACALCPTTVRRNCELLQLPRCGKQVGIMWAISMRIEGQEFLQ